MHEARHRHCRPGSLASLKLLAAVNILFLISLRRRDRACDRQGARRSPACTGSDMLAALERDDPALRSQGSAAEAAATVPTARACCGRSKRTAEEPSFLFGTMHMTDPRVTSLSPAAREAFEASDTRGHRNHGSARSGAG